MTSLSDRLTAQLAQDLHDARAILRVDDRLAFAAEQLSQALVKKYKPPGSDSQRRDKAISKFLQVNAAITASFHNDHEDPLVRSAIARGKDLLAKLFPSNRFWEPDPADGSFGPGSSNGIESSDPYGKVDQWAYGNATVLSYFLRGVPGLCLSPRVIAGRVRRARVLSTARLTTVDKDSTIDRTIAIEPNLNMYLQQGIRRKLERLLVQAFGIDLSTQQIRQRQLAYIGSIANRYATLDLSSASDTIGLAFAEWYLPQDLMFWLKEARTTHVEFDGQTVELRMLSTMGNATTFPVQTIIFSSLVRGCYEVLGLKPATSSRYYYGREGRTCYGVNGDDIIVDPCAYDLLVKVLQACGFKPNPAKSFQQGGFRESCGGDFYFGYPCRGVYIESLETPQDTYVALNRIRLWSDFHAVPLPRTLNFLANRARALERKKPGGTLRRVPIWMPVDSGVWDSTGGGAFRGWLPRSVTRVVPWYDTDMAYLLLRLGSLSACTEGCLSVGMRPEPGRVQYRLSRGFSMNWGNPHPRVLAWSLPGPRERMPFNHEWLHAQLGPEICHLGL